MKKGFTLIELLAVIVILAIIALIATPIIIGIINDSRDEANMRSTEMYLDTVRLYAAKENLNGEFSNATCKIQSNGNLMCYSSCAVSGSEVDCSEKLLEVKVENTVPVSGVIVIEDGEIKEVRNLELANRYYNLTASNLESNGEPLPRQCGDVNGDSYINEVDAYIVKAASISKITLTEEDFKYGDVDGDGRISVVDATRVKSVSIGAWDPSTFTCNLD